MNLAIEYTQADFSHLVITPRKKVLKHSLLAVRSGLVLIKLGKQEYALEPGCTMWIPFDCLTSMTFFPNTQINRVDFSVRLTDNFPKQAGLVKPTKLTQAIVDKLAMINSQISDSSNTSENASNTKQSGLNNTHSQAEHLLAVLKQEVLELRPTLSESPLSKQFNQWNIEHSPLCQEHTLVMIMREAKKRMQSGQKVQKVVNDLFSGKDEEFEQLCYLVFGESL